MFDGLLLILNDDGSFVDFKTYHDASGAILIGSIAACPYGGFFLGGATNKNGTSQGYLIKVDSLGNELWNKIFPNSSGSSISYYNQSKFILSSNYINTSESEGYGILSIIDTAGLEIWTKTYEYPFNFAHYYSRRTRSGDIVTTGITTVDGEGDSGYISRTDSIGELRWQRRYNYNEFTDFFGDFIETSDGGLLVCGAADDDFCCGGQNLWLVKLDSLGCLEPNCWVGFEDVIENDLGIKVFPNPSNEWLNFKLPEHARGVGLEVLSISGQRVMNTKLYAPLEAIQVNHLPAGLYLIKFTLGDGRSVTEKVVLGR
jgi:hypothetical protein